MTKELTVSLNEDLKESVQKIQDVVDLNKTTMRKQFQELRQLRDQTIESLETSSSKQDTSQKQIYERVGQLEASMQRPMPADSSLESSQRDRSDSDTHV